MYLFINICYVYYLFIKYKYINTHLINPDKCALPLLRANVHMDAVKSYIPEKQGYYELISTAVVKNTSSPQHGETSDKTTDNFTK